MIPLQTPVTVRIIDADRPRVVWAPGVIVARSYTSPPVYDVRRDDTGDTLQNISAENIEGMT
jgi:hypothetical protein